MRLLHRLSWAVALLAIAILLGGGSAGARSDLASHDQTCNSGAWHRCYIDGPPPDIVLVLTDDMRADELAGMPNVQALLADQGVTFDQSLVVNPLCCPSRSTILTGGTSGQTDIWTNFGNHGGFPWFLQRGEEGSTLATWLSGAGYATSLDGKYLNAYTSADAAHVPPGWTDWHGLALGTGGGDHEGKNGYFRYATADNGVATHHGFKQSAYSTTVLGGDAVSFIRSTPAGTPLFVEFAPRAPHKPAIVEDRHLDGCPGLTGVPRTPGWNEADVSDKPAYIATRPPASNHMIVNADALYVRMCQTLLSVDDQVGALMTALQDTGRLANSLIIFTSDNGINLLEHRWEGKNVPYEESIRVPLVIRYDPLTASQAGGHDQHLVQNLDLAPTIASAAGVTAPGATGENLLRLLAGDDAGWPQERLIEHWQPPGGVASPSFCGVRTAGYTYAQYATGEEELYDLTADPSELDNRAGDPGLQDLRAQLHADAMALCTPRPPHWPPTIK